MMFKFYNRIQNVYDILPTPEKCDHDIQLYQAHSGAKLFKERALQDYEHLEDLAKKTQNEKDMFDVFGMRKYYRDMVQTSTSIGSDEWQRMMNEGDIFALKDNFKKLEGSLYCYCYALQYSPLLKRDDFKSFKDELNDLAKDQEFNTVGC